MLDHFRQLIFGYSPLYREILKPSLERRQADLEAAHAEAQAEDALNRSKMRQERHNRIIVCQGGDPC